MRPENQREMPFNCVNMMAPAQHHRLIAFALLLCLVNSVHTRSSQISDLKSKITGAEELLEEFRKQLQQDQTYREEVDVADVCLGDFTGVDEHIIRARASIEQGATFLSAPDRVYGWKDCVHACCSDPHCSMAVVQEDLRQSDESLSCYLFNCTYKNKNVCSFAPQQGFSTYSRGHNTTGHLPALRRHGDGSKGVSSGRRLEEKPTIEYGSQMQGAPAMLLNKNGSGLQCTLLAVMCSLMVMCHEKKYLRAYIQDFFPLVTAENSYLCDWPQALYNDKQTQSVRPGVLNSVYLFNCFQTWTSRLAVMPARTWSSSCPRTGPCWTGGIVWMTTAFLATNGP